MIKIEREITMEKIINDLNVALANMNEKAHRFAIRSAELDMLIADEKKKLAELDARDTFILDKEAKFAEYESIEAIRAEIKADKIAIAKERSAIDSYRKKLNDEIASIGSDRAKLDEMLNLYRQKLVECSAKIKQLEEDRKNIEKKVIEEITKKLASK